MNIPGRLEATAEYRDVDPEAADYWSNRWMPTLTFNGHRIWQGDEGFAMEESAIETAEDVAVAVLRTLFRAAE